MRKVFISYSIEDCNLHLITLLLEHLRKNNFDVVVSNQGMDSTMRIINANLFIGIVTNNSNSINYVINEWGIAQRNNVPYVLVVENGVKIEDPKSLSFIRFDRSNPQEAISRLFNVPSTPKSKSNNVLFGVAVVAGIAALISLLSKNK